MSGDPVGSEASGTTRWRGTWLRNRAAVAAAVAFVGLVVTGIVSFAAWHLDRTNERRLLQVQTRQAAALVSSAIVGLEAPLQTSLDVAAATGGRPARFVHYIGASVGAGRPFTDATLFDASTPSPRVLASTGGGTPTAATLDLVRRAVHSTTFLVTSIGTTGVGYALADLTDPRYVVYAQRQIPANRQAPVEKDSAFSELHYATYLGPATTTAALTTTDVAVSHLPLGGTTERVAIPFGNTVITLVTSPRGHLGGVLGGQLWWILLLGGCLLTAGTAAAAGTMSTLYSRLGALYGEQRSISETLQHALLPQTNPTVPELDIASRYVAGAKGVDVGGDWYSLVAIDERHFAFVVGDVSGRGVSAAAIMARIRFTLRAYLVEGHGPEAALRMCAAQVDIAVDGHMATALVGVGDLATREITVANAGHPSPLLVSADEIRYLATTPGRPLGVGGGEYVPTTCTLPVGTTLLAFTDGLVERRDEDLDLGLARLAEAARGTAGQPLDATLTHLLDTMTRDGSEDDVAMLAFRWRG